MRFIAATGFIAIAVLPAPSVAQDYMPSFSNGTLMQDMSRNSMYSLQQSQRQRQSRSTNNNINQPTTRGPTNNLSAARISTIYSQSPAVTSRVKEQFLDFMQDHVDANGVEEMRQVLQNGDPVGSWASIVRSDGLRAGDLADSITAYWILNWIIANQGDNNRAQTLSVKNQVRNIIANSPTGASLRDADKQEISEAMMLNFLVQHAAYTDAMKRGDTALARRLGDAAVARFRNEMGVNLRQLRLTDQGFVPGD